MTPEEFENEFVNKIICGDWVETLKTLPSDRFHCCITSPPYWGQRNYGVEGQLGLERTPEEHIEKLVVGFREVRRVLRPDGVLWLNYGDKLWGGKGRSAHGGSEKQKARFERNESISKPHQEIGKPGWTAPDDARHEIFKAKDLLGLPWRVAFALQADGWWLRSDVIWAKALSFCEKYSGSTMPESVNGWRWERCRVKVKKRPSRDKPNGAGDNMIRVPGCENGSTRLDMSLKAEWQDCPGCPKCEPNGGYVLRKGSWRCTKAHEYLFMLTKSPHYFCDMEAVKEEQVKGAAGSRFDTGKTAGHEENRAQEGYRENSGRNLRDVWVINPQAYKGSHYATFPEALVEPCIKVSTSQKGCCPSCGAPWARIISKGELREHPARANRNVRNKADYDGTDYARRENTLGLVADTKTLGWRPTCNCNAGDPVPALVLDPFFGSGTVGMVAARLGRNYTGIEINGNYITEQAQWRVLQGETGMTADEARQGQQALFGATK